MSFYTFILRSMDYANYATTNLVCSSKITLKTSVIIICYVTLKWPANFRRSNSFPIIGRSVVPSMAAAS